MRKFRITAIFTAAVMFMGILPVNALSARSHIVIETSTGKVISESDADTRRPMASTTKIMTAVCAIESGDLSETVTVAPEAAGVEGSSVYLEAGDKVTLEDLVWALMLESANDAAAAIAIAVSGSVDAFAELMNSKAAELSLDNTHFTNPHGLHDEDHYTTARELAMLTAYALENETFRKIVAADSHTITVDGDVRYLKNHNKMLRMYDGAIGVKTGFTKASGRCLVSAAERDGMTLVAVTLDAFDDWNDHKSMLDLGFSSLERIQLIDAEESAFILPCIGGEKADFTIKNRDALSVILPRGDHNITRKVIMPHYFWAPIEDGSEVGRVEFFDGDTLIGQVTLYAFEGVERVKYKQNIFEMIFN